MNNNLTWRKTLPFIVMLALVGAMAIPSAGLAGVTVPDDITKTRAVDQRVVFGISTLDCPSGQSRVAVSPDRGASWTREGLERCAAGSWITGRVGARVLVAAGSSADLVDAALSRAPVPKGPGTGGQYVVLGGDVYQTSTRFNRLAADGGTWSACGALPLPDSMVYGAWETSRGIYAFFRLTDGSPRIARSSDGCASWQLLPQPPCDFVGGNGMGAATIVECLGSDRLVSVDDQNWVTDDGSLTSRRLAWVAPMHVVEVDRFSDPADPVTWVRASPRVSDPGIPADQAATIEWVNVRYRRPLGLPDLAWGARMAATSQNHANYYVKNGFSGHDEVVGKPGFTGEDPSARCLVVVLPGSCGNAEVAFSLPSLQRAVEGWLNTPYHGWQFIHYPVVGFGSSPGGSVGTAGWGEDGGLIPGGELDGAAPPNTLGSLLRAWPANGTNKVPIRWSGGETPDPLRNYTGDRANVGPVLFLVGYRPPLTVTLTGPAGREPLLLPAGTAAATEAVLGTAKPGDAITLSPIFPVFAAGTLKPGTRYALRVTDRDGRTLANSFTTEGASSAPRPVLGVSTTVKRFRPVAKTKAMRVAKGGLVVRVVSTQKGAAVLMYQRRLPGRRVGTTCKAGKPRKGQRACVRWVAVSGQLSVSLRAGAQVVRLTGVAGGRRLVPGVYRVRVATAARPVRQAFTGAVQVVK